MLIIQNWRHANVERATRRMKLVGIGIREV